MTTAALALGALLALSPPDAPHMALPGWAETVEARRARYASFAEDVGAVVDRACRDRELGCSRWALAVLLGIAIHESGLAPDVDAGRCYRGSGFEGRCDGGASVSVWQLRAGGEEAALYARDRRAAAREALRRAGRSWNACRRNPTAERLAAYAGGKCDPAEYRRVSRSLWGSVTRAIVAIDRLRAAE
ncbi:MAG TPA: hypothetical protein VLT47_10845 [Anaeromyxobacteraceae bacterium]|nr:hypothetical protein [Anaeromyxobacteraceae bacterium]